MFSQICNIVSVEKYTADEQSDCDDIVTNVSICCSEPSILKMMTILNSAALQVNRQNVHSYIVILSTYIY